MNNDPMYEALLNFNNYEAHPSENSYTVFHFAKKEAALYFENLLIENDVFFEKDETGNHRKKYLFGVKTRDFEKVKPLNNLTKGLYRERTIKNKFAGVFILVVTAILIILAIIGFIISNL